MPLYDIVLPPSIPFPKVCTIMSFVKFTALVEL